MKKLVCVLMLSMASGFVSADNSSFNEQISLYTPNDLPKCNFPGSDEKTSAVPEPTELAMMFAGLGIMVAVAKRKTVN